MLSKTIPSYLYQQYSDDDNLQAFVRAFNNLTQQYVDWFYSVGLPVYTGLTGALLDWVAAGLYGYYRPVLPFGVRHTIGPYNTVAYNTLPYNVLRVGSPLFPDGEDDFVTSDDTFKRVMTWGLYKGDGKVFNIRWLKRRIMRFLEGVDGTDPGVDQTYRVSVSFGIGNQVNITLINGDITLLGSSMYNTFRYNTTAYNALELSNLSLQPFALANILKAAIDSGALELPFQFDYVVTV